MRSCASGNVETRRLGVRAPTASTEGPAVDAPRAEQVHQAEDALTKAVVPGLEVTPHSRWTWAAGEAALHCMTLRCTFPSHRFQLTGVFRVSVPFASFSLGFSASLGVVSSSADTVATHGPAHASRV